jgi:hypothetical protein
MLERIAACAGSTLRLQRRRQTSGGFALIAPALSRRSRSSVIMARPSTSGGRAKRTSCLKGYSQPIEITTNATALRAHHKPTFRTERSAAPLAASGGVRRFGWYRKHGSAPLIRSPAEPLPTSRSRSRRATYYCCRSKSAVTDLGWLTPHFGSLSALGSSRGVFGEADFLNCSGC